MMAYKFYWRDDAKGFQFIGTMPERRKDPKRITHESIVNLGRKLFGNEADITKIYFVRSNLSAVSLMSWDSVLGAKPAGMMVEEQGWEEEPKPSKAQAKGKQGRAVTGSEGAPMSRGTREFR